MSIKEYEKARQLIEQIERYQQEVEARVKTIEALRQDLAATLEAAGARLRLAPLGAATGDDEASKVARNSAIAPIQPKAKLASGNQTASQAGFPEAQADLKPRPKVLGDYVREAIIEAARPLSVGEIVEKLKARNYTNSAPQPFRTLPVRLHRLQKRGVENLGGGYFFLTEEWQAKANVKMPEGFAIKGPTKKTH